MKHSEKERLAAGLSRTMLDALLTAASLTGGYGRNAVLATPRTVKALVDRGLIRDIGPTGAARYLTPLGREVLRLRAGLDVVKTLDELHAEALTDARQLDTAARGCCAFSEYGDVHNRECGTIEARKQHAPAGSAHGPERPQRSQCRCPRGHCDHNPAVNRHVQCVGPWRVGQRVRVEAAFSKPGDVWKIRDLVERDGDSPYAAIELTARVGGLPIGTTRSAVGLEWLRDLPVIGTAERYAIRPQPTFRSTVVTSEEYERAYDALLGQDNLRGALYSALRALGMTVKP